MRVAGERGVAGHSGGLRRTPLRLHISAVLLATLDHDAGVLVCPGPSRPCSTAVCARRYKLVVWGDIPGIRGSKALPTAESAALVRLQTGASSRTC